MQERRSPMSAGCDAGVVRNDAGCVPSGRWIGRSDESIGLGHAFAVIRLDLLQKTGTTPDINKTTDR